MSTPLSPDKVAEIFVKVNDFCEHFENEFNKHTLPLANGIKKRNKKTTLTDSEIITILIAFHGGQLEISNIFIVIMFTFFKDCFPNVVSDNRFIKLSHKCAGPFMLFLHHCCRGEC